MLPDSLKQVACHIRLRLSVAVLQLRKAIVLRGLSSPRQSLAVLEEGRKERKGKERKGKARQGKGREGTERNGREGTGGEGEGEGEGEGKGKGKGKEASFILLTFHSTEVPDARCRSLGSLSVRSVSKPAVGLNPAESASPCHV